LQLRIVINIVPQETIIFAVNVIKNILQGNPDATDAVIMLFNNTFRNSQWAIIYEKDALSS